MSDTRKKPLGFTLVELMVVILIIGLLIAILLPALARARAASRQMACASNERQIGVAITTYAVEGDDRLPPVDRNYWHYLAPYLGADNKRNDGGGDIFRCPVDAYKADAAGDPSITYKGLPATTVGLNLPGKGETYSYAANWAADVFLDHVDSHASNDIHTPFTFHSSGRLRRLGGVAPDTIMFIESWGECVGDLSRFDMTQGQTVNLGFNDGVVNRMMLTVEDPTKLVSGGTPALVGPWFMRAAVKDYNDATNIVAIDPTQRKFVKGYGTNNVTAHNWVLTMVEMNANFDDAFHLGRVNVLGADGSVSQEIAIEVSKTPVGSDRRWTRGRD